MYVAVPAASRGSRTTAAIHSLRIKAESDRHLGKSIVTHWLTLSRHPAGTMAGSRQKNVAGVKTIREGAE